MDFRFKVLDVVRKIPAGQTLSYKEVAERSGSPRAFRAVGQIMKQNWNSEIPCHRVIRSDGSLGGYNRGTQEKAKRLLEERDGFH
jgi:O-6-methylguanine DNA methyltransferase